VGLSTSGPAGQLAAWPAASGGLARGVPAVEPGTLFVLGPYGGLTVSPTPRLTVFFGRNAPEVHVCVGDDDPHVSRRHGQISFTGARWILHNVGRSAIRLPGSRMVLPGQRELLPMAYTPLFVVSPQREHLVEVRVAGPEPLSTKEKLPWPLTADERLVLTCLGQHYLRHEATPRALSESQVARELDGLWPAESWAADRVSQIVANVRDRLGESGITGLSGADDAVAHRLMVELVVSTTLVPPDLRLLSR
jgi:hypothetical protein